MKETKKVWRTGKTAALLLLAVLLTCAVIVPASAENSSAVFTQQEIQGMMTTGSVFSDVFEDTLYNSLDDNAKADYMATVLGSLSGPSGSAAVMMSSVPGLSSANVNPQAQVQYQTQTNSILQQYDLSTYSEPLIDRESIYYNEDAKTFSFAYNTGVLAMVKIGRDTCCDGIDENVLLAEMQNSILSREQYTADSLMASTSGNDALLIFDLTNNGQLRGTFLGLYNIVLPNSHKFSSITLKENPTVNDYKTLLSGKKLVLISQHGAIYQKSVISPKYPCLRLFEPVTDANMAVYNSDLSAQRVALYYRNPQDPIHLSNEYALLPKFFEYYYSNNKMNNAYVHLGVCDSFGNSGNVNYELAAKLLGAGANVVTGYHNSVNVPGYEQPMTEDIVDMIVNNGYSVQQAVDQAKRYNGDTDHGHGTVVKEDAYIIIHGNNAWTL
ncbi:MAG: hypothetical protein O0V67_09040 [Methanocorpusculum sp.]|nr:hypothetical protein [Methanocorpusculum sp.]